MSILPGTKAPWFASVGFQENKFLDISITDYTSAGKWIVLFFYPVDFGYVSPSELLELDARCEELEKLNCRLVAVSQDSAVVHERFASINRGFGGAFGIKFPLMEDKGGKISKLYGVDKAGAGHSFRAYFIVDPGQTVRARVVGDLPVALGIGEMVRQVRALQLAVINNIFVDSKGNKLGACPAAPDTAEQDTSKGFLTTSASFYNTKILGKSGGHLQSPVNLPAGTPDPTLGPVSFHYTAVWDTHPELRGPGALSTTTLSPQPTVVRNTGVGWEVRTPHHYQLTATDGPLHHREYRLDHLLAHWGASEHALQGNFYAGELQLVHHHIHYPTMAEAARHSGGLAVVAILLTQDDNHPNPELEKIGEVLSRIQVKGEEAQTAEVVRVEGLLPEDRDYLTYEGSLTSGEFQEGVTWVVLTQPLPVSSATLANMQLLHHGGPASARVGNNCREVQELGGRTVSRPAHL